MFFVTFSLTITLTYIINFDLRKMVFAVLFITYVTVIGM